MDGLEDYDEVEELLVAVSAEDEGTELAHGLVEETALRVDVGLVDVLHHILDAHFSLVGVVDDGDQEVQQDHLDEQLIHDPQDPDQRNVQGRELLILVVLLGVRAGPHLVHGRAVVADRVPPRLNEYAVHPRQVLILIWLVA